MGKRKRAEQEEEISNEVSTTKRMRLRSSGSLTETDLNPEPQKHAKTKPDGNRISTRMRLRSGGSVTETDQNTETQKHTKTKPNKRKGRDYSGMLPKMGMRQYVGISYQKAKRIMATDAMSSLAEVEENRHLTIGWHQLGQTVDAINYILKSSLGRYKNKLEGVLLAVGKIEVIDNPMCIADQPCMHVDLKAHCIVFRPKQGQAYKCMVTAVDKKFVTAKLYDTVTFFAPLKNIKKAPAIGDEVSIKFRRTEVKGSLCQLKGTIT